MPNMTTTTLVRGFYELRPGLRIVVPTDQLAFTVAVVCDSASPQVWHAEVSFAGATLLSTAPAKTDEQAERDAEKALTARMVELFSS